MLHDSSLLHKMVVVAENPLYDEAGLIRKHHFRKVSLLCTLAHKPTNKLVLTKAIVGV